MVMLCLLKYEKNMFGVLINTQQFKICKLDSVLNASYSFISNTLLNTIKLILSVK